MRCKRDNHKPMITLLRCFPRAKTRGSRARIKMHTSRTCSLHSSVIFLTWPISITRYVPTSFRGRRESFDPLQLPRARLLCESCIAHDRNCQGRVITRKIHIWSLSRKKQEIARKKRENFFLYLSYLLSFN